MSKQLQLSGMTSSNRFPLIYDSAKKLKPEAKRILSFGCSTGEECFSLAELFPHAEIVGVDISYYSIQTARRNNKYPERVNFHDVLGATGKYDLATCLMVLFALEKPVDFADWNEVLEGIDRHLNLDAILMIYTSDYPFEKSKVAVNYEPERTWTRIHEKNNKEYYCGYYKKNNETHRFR